MRMNAAIFAAALVGAALVGYLVPFGSKTDWSVVIKSARSSSPIAIVGNSIIDHTSKCDVDHSTIAQMLSVAVAAPVLNLSSSGQLLAETLSYAGTALRNPGIRHIVVPVSIYNFSDDWQPKFQRRLFLNMAADGVFRFPVLQGGLRGSPLLAHQPFELNGRAFPSYDRIKAEYFQAEKDAMRCPETDGRDTGYRKAYYEHVYLSGEARQENLEAIAAFSADAKRQGRAPLVVLMPTNFDLMGEDLAHQIGHLRDRRDFALAFFKSKGVETLDLSESVPNEGFADRWCACGHLLESGRRAVASAIAGAIDQSPMHAR